MVKMIRKIFEKYSNISSYIFLLLFWKSRETILTEQDSPSATTEWYFLKKIVAWLVSVLRLVHWFRWFQTTTVQTVVVRCQWDTRPGSRALYNWVGLPGTGLYTLPVHCLYTARGGTTTLCFASTVSNVGLPSFALFVRLDWSGKWTEDIMSNTRTGRWLDDELSWTIKNQWFSSYQSDLDRENDGAPQHGVWRLERKIFLHWRTFPRFLIRTRTAPLCGVCWVVILSLAAIKSVHAVSFRHLGPTPPPPPTQYSVFEIGLNLHDNRWVLDPSRYSWSITEPAHGTEITSRTAGICHLKLPTDPNDSIGLPRPPTH